MTAMPFINLATDPALPQRDLLLDVDEVARRFSRKLGSDGALKIDRCEQLRVKYSPGVSLRVLHRIRVGTSSYTIAARAFTGGRSEPAFERSTKKAVSCGRLLPVARDAELDTVYWTFPNDRKISNLSVLASPPDTLSRLFSDRWAQSRIVAYAPEKCVTAQCLSDDNELLAYAKVYSDDEQCRHEIYDSLRKNNTGANSNLCMPRLLTYSEAHRTLLLEPIAGLRIADLNSARRPDGFRRLGASLAALHSIPISRDLPKFERLGLDRLQEAARIIGRVRPDVAGLAGDLAKELCERRNAFTEPNVCLHGDVHPKNGILQEHCVALIDLDQAGEGPAAADLGSLLAALSYSRRVGALSRASERKLASAFLSGYSEARELPQPESLRWHTAAALLAERAIRAVNRIRREGLKHLNELLLDSRRLLRERDCE